MTQSRRRMLLGGMVLLLAGSAGGVIRGDASDHRPVWVDVRPAPAGAPRPASHPATGPAARARGQAWSLRDGFVRRRSAQNCSIL
jgi:hypothetical protein